jgi:hypothetical protein
MRNKIRELFNEVDAHLQRGGATEDVDEATLESGFEVFTP